MSVLFYRRPDYLNKEGGPITNSTCQRYVERAKSELYDSGHSYNADFFSDSERAIPNGLSFEDIMDNKALPVSLQVFGG